LIVGAKQLKSAEIILTKNFRKIFNDYLAKTLAVQTYIIILNKWTKIWYCNN